MLPWSLHLDPRFATLRQLYWRLRLVRSWDSASRRRIYRLISVERRKFDATFFEGELLRLYCRHLANPGNKAAERRYVMLMESIPEEERKL